MKFLLENYLKEEFGESATLDTFVYQANDRFPNYYVIKVEDTNTQQIQRSFYAYEKAALNAYENRKKEHANNKGYKIQMYKVGVNLIEEELDSMVIDEDDSEKENIAIGEEQDDEIPTRE